MAWRKPQIEEALRRIEECRRRGATELDLGGLELDAVPYTARTLRQLRSLDLGGNRLATLPDWIDELSALEFLSVSSNRLAMLPPQMAALRRLHDLYAAGNPHVSLPPYLANLGALEILVLSDTGLTRVPSFISHLKKLERLYLDGNDLEELPEWLRGLPNLSQLDVRDNSRLKIPTEIALSATASEILTYYRRSVAGGEPLNEFKLVLVGRGGVGKTSLVHRLVADKYKKFGRTPGIQITDWPVQIDGDTVRAHIWDFGGQEIMHGTHRFFMTERALYLILISGREGNEDHDAEYWLSLVRSFAGEVPVIVLLHKCDDYPVELTRELLRDKYGRDLVFLETDSATRRGLTALQEEICRQAGKLPGLKAAWPSEWRRVKEDLPAADSNWITFDDFRAFCRDRGVGEPKDQEALADSLHALGLMLCYQHDEALRKFGVLNPQWVTQGIYQMLNAPALREAEGKFTLESFSEILPEKSYPAKLHPFLLALMRKFQLCHPLDDEGKLYLITELLTKEEPPSLDSIFIPEQCLNFIYRYDAVLPEGLLPRFIVETYVHSKQKLAWRTGVVLERANCRALVRGDIQGRVVTIRVSGAQNGRRELLGIVREYFERLHRTYRQLPVTEWVPIPQHPQSMVRYDSLLKRERAGRQTIEVEIENEVMDLDVRELLDGIDLPGAMRTKPWSDAVRVFISYAREDAKYLDRLHATLVPFERRGQLKVWADRQIDAGQMWEEEIARNLDLAQVAILLLSPDFLASDYAMTREVPALFARKDCTVVPILARPCPFAHDFGQRQVIPAKAISQYHRPDDAWMEVTRHLDRVLEKLKRD